MVQQITTKLTEQEDIDYLRIVVEWRIKNGYSKNKADFLKQMVLGGLKSSINNPLFVKKPNDEEIALIIIQEEIALAEKNK